MRKNGKVIITCAVTGAIHTPTLSEGLPYTPADIARQAIEAAQAGAAILHLHARDLETGAPTGDPDIFAKFLPEINASSDAVINLTTGGSPDITGEQRLAAALRFTSRPRRVNGLTGSNAGSPFSRHASSSVVMSRPRLRSRMPFVPTSTPTTLILNHLYGIRLPTKFSSPSQLSANELPTHTTRQVSVDQTCILLRKV